MRKHQRRLIAAVLVAAISAVLAVLLARGAETGVAQKTTRAQAVAAHAALREREQGEGEGAGPEAEAYSDRAYPATRSRSTRSRARSRRTTRSRAAERSSARNGTSSGPTRSTSTGSERSRSSSATQWSGRVTALAIDPKCKPQECTLYVGAAGGGVWRSKNALAPNPAWKHISDGIPTNAIGSIAVDPNDPTGKTIYVGTGEANASGDSEAGARPLQDDRRRRALVARPGLVRGREQPGDRVGRDRPGRREPHPDRDALGRARHRLEQHERRHAAAESPATGIYASHRRRRELRADAGRAR